MQDASTVIAADRPRGGASEGRWEAARLETPVEIKSFFQLEEKQINGKRRAGRTPGLVRSDGQQVALVGCSQPSQLPPQVGAGR